MAEISVVIPAFNAADTLRRTLASACAQTFADIEIIVVDDGSNDGTADVCAAAMENDPRIRLISSPNGGVARARNLGIAASSGAYVAPLDADDVWHPLKLERQRERLEADPEVGLVYNWFRRINEQDEVLAGSAHPVVEGRVLHRHLAENFIGNGSTPLIRGALLETIAYEPALRDAGNEGCEDYLIQLRLAAVSRFACVPAFLTGYRRRPRAMSGDNARMLRSHIQVFRMLDQDAPPSARAVIRSRLVSFHVQLARNRIRRAKVDHGAALLGRAFLSDAREALDALGDEFALLWRMVSRTAAAPLSGFETWDVSEKDGLWARHIHERASAYIGLDQAMERLEAPSPGGPRVAAPG